MAGQAVFLLAGYGWHQEDRAQPAVAAPYDQQNCEQEKKTGQSDRAFHAFSVIDQSFQPLTWQDRENGQGDDPDHDGKYKCLGEPRTTRQPSA